MTSPPSGMRTLSRVADECGGSGLVHGDEFLDRNDRQFADVGAGPVSRVEKQVRFAEAERLQDRVLVVVADQLDLAAAVITPIDISEHELVPAGRTVGVPSGGVFRVWSPWVQVPGAERL